MFILTIKFVLANWFQSQNWICGISTFFMQSAQQNGMKRSGAFVAIASVHILYLRLNFFLFHISLWFLSISLDNSASSLHRNHSISNQFQRCRLYRFNADEIDNRLLYQLDWYISDIGVKKINAQLKIKLYSNFIDRQWPLDFPFWIYCHDDSKTETGNAELFIRPNEKKKMAGVKALDQQNWCAIWNRLSLKRRNSGNSEKKTF